MVEIQQDDMASRNGGPMGSADAGTLPALADRAVALLDRWMARRVADEDKPDHHYTGEVANALGVNKGTARRLLDELFAHGRIKRLDFSNGIAWRSINPLPYEPGGTLDLARRAATKRTPFSTPVPIFILQREVIEGSRRFWFDAERFENESRARSALRLAESSSRSNASPWDVYRAPQRIRLVVEVPARGGDA